MQQILSLEVKAAPRQPLGEAVALALTRLHAIPEAKYTLLAVVPQMLTFFAASPHRYEVTEATIIVGREQ